MLKSLVVTAKFSWRALCHTLSDTYLFLCLTYFRTPAPEIDNIPPQLYN